MLSDASKCGAMQEEGAALEAGRNAAQADLVYSHKQLSYTHKHVQELLQQITELETSKHKLEQDFQEETLKLRQRLLTETHELHVRQLLNHPFVF
jgi:septal ring factor EnvC (AmiA/AmiB activator)